LGGEEGQGRGGLEGGVELGERLWFPKFARWACVPFCVVPKVGGGYLSGMVFVCGCCLDGPSVGKGCGVSR
jgi:hypothetical protein